MSENENNLKKERLIKILSDIPDEAWKEIVRKEPEWKFIEQIYKVGFGPSSVIMVATGLNDYQLKKGGAEEVYWPEILKYLPNLNTPMDINEIYNSLKPFYENERFHEAKLKRLEKFLHSDLASNTLWKSTPNEVSSNFKDIWKELAGVMGQKEDKKTIVFAMKCLWISLLKADECVFDLKGIPIPVDKRVSEFTEKLTGNKNHIDFYIDFWNDVLNELQKTRKNITIFHLDSLIWQISPLIKENQEEKRIKFLKYFEDLKIPDIGEKLWNLLQ
jgi:DNA-(apurinic or apyrimidinic site) lyase